MIKQYNGSSWITKGHNKITVFDIQSNYLTQEPVTVPNGQPEGSQYNGTVSYIFESAGSPPIPDNGTYVASKYQWLRSSYSKTISIYGKTIGVDDRDVTYDNCNFKFTVPTGNYVLVFEAVDKSGQWKSDRLSYGDSKDDFRVTPIIAIVNPDDTELLHIDLDMSNDVGSTYVHKEWQFTAANTVTFGLFFKGIGHRISSEYFEPRFMVVRDPAKTTPFDITYANKQFTGVSSWIV